MKQPPGTSLPASGTSPSPQMAWAQLTSCCSSGARAKQRTGKGFEARSSSGLTYREVEPARQQGRHWRGLHSSFFPSSPQESLRLGSGKLVLLEAKGLYVAQAQLGHPSYERQPGGQEGRGSLGQVRGTFEPCKLEVVKTQRNGT